MAEQQDDSQEKTEEPSEQKKRRAQEEGRTIHSKDLLSLAALAAAFGALAVQGQAMVSSLTSLLRQALLLQQVLH
jgi:flagellar biosynthetic protein FlhB